MRNRAVVLLLVRRGLSPDSQEKVPIPWFQHKSSTGRLGSRKARELKHAQSAGGLMFLHPETAKQDARNKKETVARRRKLSPYFLLQVPTSGGWRLIQFFLHG